jgi:hypothetical protein
MSRSRLLAVACVSAAAPVVSPLQAQICNGTPSTGSVEYNYEQRSVGSSNGVMGTLVGTHVGASALVRFRSITTNLAGQEGQVRVHGIFGSPRFKVCPGVRIGLVHDVWDARSDLSLTSNTLTLGAGIGAGYEQPVYRGIYVIPFGMVGYGFNAVMYDLKATNAQTDVTGDTLSGVIADYGAIAHYRYVYAGYVGTRAPGSDKARPSTSRFVIGVTFSDRSRRK